MILVAVLVALVSAFWAGWWSRGRSLAGQLEDALWEIDSLKGRLDQDRQRRLAALGSSVTVWRVAAADTPTRYKEQPDFIPDSIPPPPPKWARKRVDPIDRPLYPPLNLTETWPSPWGGADTTMRLQAVR